MYVLKKLLEISKEERVRLFPSNTFYDVVHFPQWATSLTNF